MWLNISSSLTHSPRFCFVFSSQNEFSMSPIGVGFLTIPLPEPVTILMIDCSTLDCGEREERGPQRQKKKEKEGEEGGKRGVDNPTRSEWCPVFCFQWWDQWPVQPRGDRQSNRRPGRNRCSYTMNTHLVGCLFTKSQGADFLFSETKERQSREPWLSTCRPVSGKNVAEVIRLWCSMIYVLLKIRPYNRWPSIYGHDNMVKLHINLVCVFVCLWVCVCGIFQDPWAVKHPFFLFEKSQWRHSFLCSDKLITASGSFYIWVQIGHKVCTGGIFLDIWATQKHNNKSHHS